MLRIIGLSVLVASLVGCTAPREHSVLTSSGRPESPAGTRKAGSPSLPGESRADAQSIPTTQAARQARPVSTQSGDESPQPLSIRTATHLQGDFLIEVLTPESLTVRRNARTRSEAALFEQAITLARVRSVLATTLSRSTVEGVTLKNSTVTVVFPKTTDPIEGAEAIARVLDVQGVERLKATFK